MLNPIFLLAGVLLAGGWVLLVYFDKAAGRPKLKRLFFSDKPYPFWVYLGLVLAASVLRTLIEWYSTRQTTFVYAIPDMGAGYLNSFTWLFFLVIINPLVINYFVQRESVVFRQLVHSSVVFLSVLFVLVGVGDVLLSYNYLRWPVFYNFKYFIFPVYMPAGCLGGFVIAAGLGAVYLAQQYCPEEKKRVVAGVILACVGISFFYGYQLALWLPYVWYHVFYGDAVLIPVFAAHQDLYPSLKTYNILFEAFWFMLPVVFCFPAFIRHYAVTEQERKNLKGIYVGLILVLGVIFYLAMYALDADLKHILSMIRPR